MKQAPFHFLRSAVRSCKVSRSSSWFAPCRDEHCKVWYLSLSCDISGSTGKVLEDKLPARSAATSLLLQVIRAIILVQLPAGATVIHQGAMPGDGDCMYLLASGEVDIVIAGGGDQSSSNEDRKASNSPLLPMTWV